MKLLNPNEPLPQEPAEEKRKPKAENPPRPPTKRVIHHPITVRHYFAETDRTTASASQEEEFNPGRKLRAFEAAARTAKPSKLPARYRLRPDREKTRYAFWDIAGALSLVINAILLGILLIMAWQIRTLKQAVGTGLLGGLYKNFADLRTASINTTITVNAQIPLNFSLPVQTNTDVTLTRDVNIPGAHVIITTPLFNINAPANVTLPVGTRLPIALNLDIPVQASVPVSLQVPVDILISNTSLDERFKGLQETILPFYCTLLPNAEYPPGKFVCQQTDLIPPATGVP